MKKNVAPKLTPTPAKSVEKIPASVNDFKGQFVGAAVSMSWQLALVVLIPVVGGFKLDQHFKTLPLWTIVGFCIAVTGVVLVLRNVLEDFSQGGKK
jgi:F0F1-type ATP synthase assembly protein I